jgi:hypothetical protein
MQMISDEDMARQLQDEEEEAAKVRRKLMEEEVELLVPLRRRRHRRLVWFLLCFVWLRRTRSWRGRFRRR